MRVRQPKAEKGSQKWLQCAVNSIPPSVDKLLLAHLPGVGPVTWLSPLAADEYAEYRDSSFLKLIGAQQLAPQLAEFFPDRGPQWDALAKCADGTILLVEAKSHIGELCTSPSGAGEASRRKIEVALKETADYIGAKPRAEWTRLFYQLANRIAHLYFLRKHDLKARLVLINYIGDKEVGGPFSEPEWKAAYEVVRHVMGIPERHKLSADMIEIFPEVRSIA
jgi:hypothetical protein